MLAQTDLSRRRMLNMVAVTVAGGMMTPTSVFSRTVEADAAPLLLGSEVCVITPESIEGPYYCDPKLTRSDITEGKKGTCNFPPANRGSLMQAAYGCAGGRLALRCKRPLFQLSGPG